MTREEIEQTRKDNQEIVANFKIKLEEKYKVQDNPKKEKLWRIAYNIGHAHGLQEIEYYYDELVELIK